MQATNILDPISDINKEIHIIGCGAIGSNLAVMLTRLGAPNIVLWDDDVVEAHNITNQVYTDSDINQPKVVALANHLTDINPNVVVTSNNCKYVSQRLSGYVFLAVDSIDTRNKIVDTNKINRNIIAMGDFRMGLYEAQAYLYPWKGKYVQMLKDTMTFTDKEAEELIPVSPCGTHLSVLPTIQATVSAGVQNFINFIRDRDYANIIIVDLSTMSILTI